MPTRTLQERIDQVKAELSELEVDWDKFDMNSPIEQDLTSAKMQDKLELLKWLEYLAEYAKGK